MARVLVIEDDPRVRDALARGLTRSGHEVVPAADGPGAVTRPLAGRAGL